MFNPPIPRAKADYPHNQVEQEKEIAALRTELKYLKQQIKYNELQLNRSTWYTGMEK